jgi:hypothetical protein
VADGYKHASLLHNDINYHDKRFIAQALGATTVVNTNG